jgi:hypothetical protein
MQREGASGGHRRQGDLAGSDGVVQNITKRPIQIFIIRPLLFTFRPLIWINRDPNIFILPLIFTYRPLNWMVINNRDPKICKMPPGGELEFGSPSLRSTSGLSAASPSPSRPSPPSFLAESARPHLHLMHSSPGISVLHSLLLTQQVLIMAVWRPSEPSAYTEQRRPSLKHMQPSIAGFRVPPPPVISCKRTSVKKLIPVLVSKQISLFSRT